MARGLCNDAPCDCCIRNWSNYIRVYPKLSRSMQVVPVAARWGCYVFQRSMECKALSRTSTTEAFVIFPFETPEVPICQANHTHGIPAIENGYSLSFALYTCVHLSVLSMHLKTYRIHWFLMISMCRLWSAQSLIVAAITGITVVTHVAAMPRPWNRPSYFDRISSWRRGACHSSLALLTYCASHCYSLPMSSILLRSS